MTLCSYLPPFVLPELDAGGGLSPIVAERRIGEEGLEPGSSDEAGNPYLNVHSIPGCIGPRARKSLIGRSRSLEKQC